MNTPTFKRIPKSEMFKRLKISPDKLNKTLISLGTKYCYSEVKDKWTEKNPTYGYCYKLCEVVSFRLKKLGLTHYSYQIKTKSSNHWFIVLEVDGSIIGFLKKKEKYENGVRRNFFPCYTKSNMSLGAEAIAKGLGIL